MASPFNDDPTDFGSIPSTGSTIPKPATAAPPAPRGPSRSTQGDVHWKIQTIEPKGLSFRNFVVVGQFPLNEEGLTIRLNQVIPDAGTYNIPLPFVQWVRGEVQVITFDVVLFSRDKDEDVWSRFQEMQRLQTFVTELGRPPLCLFTYGSFLSIKCLVQGFGDVKIGRPRTDGQARKIEFAMSLKRYKSFKIPTLDRNQPVKKSMHRIVGGDDRMYERIARRYYGADNAIYGVRLRRELMNREYPFAAQDGEKVQIPRADKVVVGNLVPTFHAFQTSVEEVSDMFLERAIARNNHVLIR